MQGESCKAVGVSPTIPTDLQNCRVIKRSSKPGNFLFTDMPVGDCFGDPLMASA